MEENREYRAVCFDLDGTLLHMDIDEFMGAYFSRIGKYAEEHGLDARLFKEAIKHGTQAMALSDDDRSNKDVFWDDFDVFHGRGKCGGVDPEAMADSFYDTEFDRIGDGFVGSPDVPRAVRALKEKGYPLVLTTMPMFPLRAVQHRLEWAGLDPDDFERITSYENSKSTKPRQTYFAENLAAMGIDGKDVLLVGNNTMEDLAFLDLGVDAYLVTDCLLDPVGYDLGTIKHGTFAEFADWAESLPRCADPATGIQSGLVDRADMERAFRENAVKSAEEMGADANAQALAEAIRNDVPLGKMQK